MLLGALHGVVGVAQDLIGMLVGRRPEHHADAAGDENFLALESKRRGQLPQHAVGHGAGFLGSGRPFHQDGEFVAAEPGQGVGLAQQLLQPVGDHHEQPVAGHMPEGLVDELEPVDVQVQDGVQGLGIVLEVLYRLIQPVEEQGPVEQAGQGVVEGVVQDMLFQLFFPGDVREQDEHARDGAVDARQAQVVPDRALGRTAGQVDIEMGLGPRQHRRKPPAYGVGRGLGNPLGAKGRKGGRQRGVGVDGVEQVAIGRVGGHDGAARVEHGGMGRKGFQQG